MKDPIGSGMLLGLANLVVIAIGLAIAVPTRQLFFALGIIGFVPALLLGGLVGGIAHLTDRCATWVRLILMAPIPVGFIFVSTTALRFGPAADGTVIPTFVAVLLLERWSRRCEPPVLPVATMR